MVSSLGLGLAALGRPAYIDLGHAADLEGSRSPDALERRAHAVLDAAHAAGVRYVDVARSYGRAEAFLASWLAARSVRPEEITVGSKWGYTYTADWRTDVERHEVKDLSAATLERQLAETRAILGDRLALYQIHSATLESGVLEDGAVWDRLERLRGEGVAIGITTTGPDQAATIRRAVERGGVDVIQATWNLLERSAGAALAEAHAAGVGVIVKEALANGRLTDRGGLVALHGLAEQRGTSSDALALSAALAQPWADVVLLGVADPGQLASNLAARGLEGTDVSAVLEALVEEPESYWATRARLPWT